MASLNEFSNNEHVDELFRYGRKIRDIVSSVRNDSLAGDIARSRVQDLMKYLPAMISIFGKVRPNLDPVEARKLYPNYGPTWDITAQAAAMATACSNLRQTVFDSFPRHNGANTSWLLGYPDIDGNWIDEVFTTAQLTASGFHTMADALLFAADPANFT